MLSSNTKIILFDAVGTVMFAQPDIAQAYVEIGGRFISGLDPQQVLTRFKDVFSTVFSAENARNAVTEESTLDAWRQVVEGTFPEFNEAGGELFEQLWSHFADGDSWRVYEDVADCFDRLQEQGFELGIASNFDRRLEQIVVNNPVLSRVQHVFHSAQLGWNKPARGFCEGITKRLEVSPNQICLVGDRLDNDIQPALAAGWQGIWIDRESRNIEGDGAIPLGVSRIMSLSDLG
ncbi:MAG: hypothetical protein CMJ82_04620 [Planctomycetaceae bacterium]|nr:hypothetical protein [Planctomycetaceae bacterium]|tara:strand:- start:1916 stop:2617 length:702 start_codon:yes stop_codon:yes gene_type:complete